MAAEMRTGQARQDLRLINGMGIRRICRVLTLCLRIRNRVSKLRIIKPRKKKPLKKKYRNKKKKNKILNKAKKYNQMINKKIKNKKLNKI